jgi:hypothetical protein
MSAAITLRIITPAPFVNVILWVLSVSTKACLFKILINVAQIRAGTNRKIGPSEEIKNPAGSYQASPGQSGRVFRRVRELRWLS